MVLLLAGCWPYIDGKWRAYLDPDPLDPVPVVVGGSATWRTHSKSGSGEILWGVVEDPGASYDPRGLVAPIDTGCVSDDAFDRRAAVGELDPPAGVEENTIVGPDGAILLTPDDAQWGMLAADLSASDVETGFAYTWPEFSSDDATFASDVLFRFEDAILVQGPDIESMEAVDTEQFVWEWVPVDGADRFIGVEILLLDGAGELLEGRYCTAAASSDHLDATAEWGHSGTGVLWTVEVLDLAVADASLADQDGIARFVTAQSTLQTGVHD